MTANKKTTTNPRKIQAPPARANGSDAPTAAKPIIAPPCNISTEPTLSLDGSPDVPTPADFSASEDLIG
jgi:hypothetical protein